MPLDYAGFHFTDLHNFRQRLLANEQEALVFDALLAKIQACDFLKKRGKQRTGSTQVVGVVQKLSRLELVTETLRVTLHDIQAVDEAWARRVLPAAWCEAYLERRRNYRLSDAERQSALRKAGQGASHRSNGGKLPRTMTVRPHGSVSGRSAPRARCSEKGAVRRAPKAER